MSALAFIPSIALGLLVVFIAWPGPYRCSLGLKLSISLALGPGIVSCLYFIWCLFMRPRSRVYFLAEWLLLGALLLLAWLLRKYKAGQPPLFPSVGRPDGLERALLGVFGIAMLIAGINFVIQTLMQPYGIQDAWNIWNMRARFMFRGGSGWTDLFSPDLYWLNHPDYPFLITAGAARTWSLAGQESPLAPAIQAALYALATIGLLLNSIALKRGWGQGAIAATILAGSPIFVLLAGWQIADVPLAFFITASVFLLVLMLEHPGRRGLYFLLGLCTGLAAWTKNEGIPWMALCLAAFILAQLIRRKPAAAVLKETAVIFSGLALPLVVLLYLKLILAPASDLFAGQATTSLIERFLDPQRYILTISYSAKALAGASPIGLAVLPTIPLLTLYLFLFFPPQVDRPRLSHFIYPAAAIILQAAGYFVIYLITPHDLVWHLRTAVDRLIFQVTPPVLLLVFLVVRSPADLLSFHSLSQRHSRDFSTKNP